MHVHSGVFGDRPIRCGLSLLLIEHRRAGAGSRTREEPSETRRTPKSHSRPENAHLEHRGRVSSHLILLRLYTRVSIGAIHMRGATYRQVLHPSLVGLEVTTRFLPMSCHCGCTITTTRPTRAMLCVYQTCCGAWLSNQCTYNRGIGPCLKSM